MAKVLIMGSDLPGEQALLRRLEQLAQAPGLTLGLCHDASDCDLLVVREKPSLLSFARRIAGRHPWLPAWSLAEDGRLHDLRRDPAQLLDDQEVRTLLQRLHLVARSRPPVAPKPIAVPAHSPLSVQLRQRLAAADTVAALSLEGHDVLLLDFRRLLAIVPPNAATAGLEPAQRVGQAFERLQLRTLAPAQYPALFLDLPSQPMVPLLWQAALRMALVPVLLEPLHEGSRVRLQRWPDFRVLAHRHDDFRLCSLLLRRASTALEASHALGVDPGAVRAFLNAAWLSGYAQVESEIAVAPVAAAPTRQRGPGALLASMWRGLRRGRQG